MASSPPLNYPTNAVPYDIGKANSSSSPRRLADNDGGETTSHTRDLNIVTAASLAHHGDQDNTSATASQIIRNSFLPNLPTTCTVTTPITYLMLTIWFVLFFCLFRALIWAAPFIVSASLWVAKLVPKLAEFVLGCVSVYMLAAELLGECLEICKQWFSDQARVVVSVPE